jgi:glyoxylase-like metal-dependent hydrolase (beta-lactamase superfamily II)
MIDPVEVTELRPGLWRWATDHPDWVPDGGLSRTVGSVYFEAPGTVVLVDPLVPEDEDEERFWRALDRDVERVGRPVVVVLTVPWHERSTALVVDRYGGSVADHPPEGVEAIRITGVGGEAETVFWLPEPGALVFGDILVGSPPRILDEWQPEDRRGEPARAELRPLLGLPVELLLPSHGDPVVADAAAVLAEAVR